MKLLLVNLLKYNLHYRRIQLLLLNLLDKEHDGENGWMDDPSDWP